MVGWTKQAKIVASIALFVIALVCKWLCSTRRQDRIRNEISKIEEPSFYPHNYRIECQTFAELVELKRLTDFLHLDISDVYTRVSLYANIPTLYPCSLQSTTEGKLKLMRISNLCT